MTIEDIQKVEQKIQEYKNAEAVLTTVKRNIKNYYTMFTDGVRISNSLDNTIPPIFIEDKPSLIFI